MILGGSPVGVASAPKYPELLEDWTWAQIAEVAGRGEMQKYHSIGDEKNLTFTTGGTFTLRIEDFNHDDLADGSGKANVTFALKHLIAALYPMNQSHTNAGGWDGCVMRKNTIPLLLDAMPNDLQSIIKPVKKRTTAGSQSTAIIESVDMLWLFSAKEIGQRSTVEGYRDEGETYPLFTNNENRIKYLSNGNGASRLYWTRSALINDMASFSVVSTTGGVSTSYAANENGVCFGFCI